MSIDIYYWNLFCKYGDINYLSHISSNGQTVIKSFIGKNVKYKGLQRILTIYYSNIKIPFVNKLTNVISLTYHVLNNKKIYIFGEHHYPTDNCSINKTGIPVFDFIKMNIENIPKFIDIFLESPFIMKDQEKLKQYIDKSQIGTLRNFEKQYSNCLYFKHCNLPNIRFHRTDVRKIVFQPPFVPYILHLIYMIENIIRSKKLEDYKKYLQVYHNIINNQNYNESINIYKEKSKNINTLIPLLHYPFSKIRKQIDNTYIDLFKNYIERSLKEIDQKYIDFNFINNFITNLPKNKFPIFTQYDTLKTIVVTNLTFESIFMDIYLLARVFRKFNNEKYKNSKEPENIIIYVGDKHAQTYRKILNQLKFDNTFKSYAKQDEFCIDISKLKQPLFS